MPRALARSAYGTRRRIGEAGISIARLERLTLLNATRVTFAPASLSARLPTEYTRPTRSRKRRNSLDETPKAGAMLSADSAFRPTFYVEGVLHYCLANMPGAVPRNA